MARSVPTPLVRAARPADYDAIAALTVGAYVDDGLAGEEYRPALADVAGRAGRTEVLVAEVDGQVVGSVAFARHGSPDAEITAGPDEAAFRMLAVAPVARGRGVGAALVEACLARAKALGVRRMVISSEVRMSAAHRLYGRLGFLREPRRDWSPLPGVSLLCYVREVRPADL